MKTIVLQHCFVCYWWLFLLCRPALAWFASSSNKPAAAARTKTTTAVPCENVKLLILPGFGNDSSDYYLKQAPEGSLVNSLKKRGWKDENVKVLPLKRADWLQVFTNGILDVKFWQNCAPPTRSAFAWYLRRVADCINDLTADDDDDNGNSKSNSKSKVVLICHSAGGWLARAALGYGSGGDAENGFARCLDLSKIGGIVTLGAPHDPPPPPVMDMTRGALRLTSESFPGAYHNNNNHLFYITVIGDAVRGVKQERRNPLEPTSTTGFAFSSYKAVCGNGEAVGDGVVPKMAAHLDGAVQLDLEGIFHSINVPDRWYGSDSVIDQWHDEMTRQIQRTSSSKSIIFANPLESIFR